MASVIFASCTRTGYYYIDKSNDEEEYVAVNDDGVKKLGLAASVIDTSLNVIVFFKLLDTATNKSFSIENISFIINNLSSTRAKKSVLFIDSPLEVKYEELTEIVDLDERIRTSLPLEFLFEFSNKDLNDGKIVHVRINISIIENGRKTQIEREFDLVRKSRYSSWFATICCI